MVEASNMPRFAVYVCVFYKSVADSLVENSESLAGVWRISNVVGTRGSSWNVGGFHDLDRTTGALGLLFQKPENRILWAPQENTSPWKLRIHARIMQCAQNSLVRRLGPV